MWPHMEGRRREGCLSFTRRRPALGGARHTQRESGGRKSRLVRPFSQVLVFLFAARDGPAGRRKEAARHQPVQHAVHHHTSTPPSPPPSPPFRPVLVAPAVMADSLSKLCRKFRSPGLTKRKSGSEQSDERGPSRTFGLPGPDGRGGALLGSHDVSDDHGYNGATNTAAKRHKGYTSRSPHTLREPTRVLGRHNGSANPDEDAADHDEDEGSIGYMPLSESQLTRHGGATPAASTAPAHRAEDSPLAGPSRSPGSARLSNPSLLVPSLSSDRGDKRYYTCLWRNPSTRKNKNWDGDGVVIVHDGGKRLTLMDAALQTRCVWHEENKTSFYSFSFLCSPSFVCSNLADWARTHAPPRQRSSLVMRFALGSKRLVSNSTSA